MNNLEYKENKMNLRKAFTLAEVLITVTIIGTVAALTIPSFMSDTSQRSNAVALKKAISALDQAVDMSRAESKFQPMPKCYISDVSTEGHQFDQCKDLFVYIKDMMQVSKYCESDPVSGGCMQEYNSDFSACEDWSKLENKKAFVTTDGMIYFEYSDEKGASNIGVDVNGSKGPNKWGYDVFSLGLYGHKGVMQTYQPGGCEPVDLGGMTGYELLKEAG